MDDNKIQEIEDFYKNALDKMHGIRRMLLTYPDLPKDDISEKHDQISDLILFIVIVQIDIAICSKHLLINKQIEDHYEMNYFSRILATHCSDMYQTAKGRILFKLKGVTNVYKNSTPDLKELAKKLSNNRLEIFNIGRTNYKFIEDIRNNLFAHRDGTGIEQNNYIDEIDTGKLVHIATDIGDTLDTIIKNLLAIQTILAPMVNE